MTWTTEYGPQIPQDLKRLDKPVRTRVLDYLDQVIASGDPRLRGEALTGDLAACGGTGRRLPSHRRRPRRSPRRLRRDDLPPRHHATAYR